MSPLHSQGSPNKGGQNQKSKPPLGVTMMPLSQSISKYGSLVQPDAQIVALRMHCAKCTPKKDFTRGGTSNIMPWGMLRMTPQKGGDYDERACA